MINLKENDHFQEKATVVRLGLITSHCSGKRRGKMKTGLEREAKIKPVVRLHLVPMEKK